MRKLENQKELIKASAKTIIIDKNQSISMRKIAKDCEISVGTLYNYYKNKSEIILDLMSDFWHDFIEEAIEVIKKSDDSYKQLRLLYECLSENAEKFRFTLLSSEMDNSLLLDKGRTLHREAFGKFVGVILMIFPTISKDDALFIAFNLFSIIKTKGYEYNLFEQTIKKYKVR